MNSTIKDVAKGILSSIGESIENDRCSEEDLVEMVGKYSEVSKGRYSDSDLMNVDECCRMLGVSRSGFYAIVKRERLREVTINNQKVGYRRVDIERLRAK